MNIVHDFSESERSNSLYFIKIQHKIGYAMIKFMTETDGRIRNAKSLHNIITNVRICKHPDGVGAGGGRLVFETVFLNLSAMASMPEAAVVLADA